MLEIPMQKPIHILLSWYTYCVVECCRVFVYDPARIRVWLCSCLGLFSCLPNCARHDEHDSFANANTSNAHHRESRQQLYRLLPGGSCWHRRLAHCDFKEVEHWQASSSQVSDVSVFGAVPFARIEG